MYRIEGGFEVDIDKRCLRGADGEIHLRPKTFTVLKILIENRDRMVSKDEILSTAWKETAVTEDALVTIITELRKAFSDPPRASRFIKTVHGAGYRWIASVQEVETTDRDVALSSSRPRPIVWRVAIAAGLLVAVSAGVGAWWLRIRRGITEHKEEAAWWKFDEGSGDALADSSGHGNTGMVHPGVRRISGPPGRGLEFDGIGGGASGRLSSSIPLGNGPRTIALRVETNSTNGDFTNLFQYGVNGPQPPAANFNLALTPDGRIQAGNGFNFGFITGKSRIDNGTWHWLAAVYDGARTNRERIYVDGVEDASGSLSSPPATLDGSWAMGQFLGGGTPFRGSLGDVRVFDRPLRSAEVQALFRCSSGIEDLRIGDQSAFYFLPVFSTIPGIVDGEIGNMGRDLSGIQLARSDGVCAAASLEGAPAGQDLYLSAELKTPGDASGHRTEAGIYFRSRKAHAGDGIVGGTSAGYWVRLRTGGQVSVMCLNPAHVVAFANVPGVAADAYHRMEIAAIGANLEVRLDGKLLEFDQGGRATTTVSIPSSWEAPRRIGNNDGTLGVAFSADLNREKLGGQAARNFIVRPAAKLLSAR